MAKDKKYLFTITGSIRVENGPATEEIRRAFRNAWEVHVCRRGCFEDLRTNTHGYVEARPGHRVLVTLQEGC